MKYLIVGLGNIGEEYWGTRHNIGFRVVNALAEAHSAKFEENRYGATCEFRVKNQQLKFIWERVAPLILISPLMSFNSLSQMRVC